jgi:multicomponent Na+:H+ antiporter subunit B
MKVRTRRQLFLLAALSLGGLLLWGLTGVQGFGHYDGVYGLLLNHTAVVERHATNVVMAVTFDYRGFDTLGEEFILFAAVMSVALLLREEHTKTE